MFQVVTPRECCSPAKAQFRCRPERVVSARLCCRLPSPKHHRVPPTPVGGRQDGQTNRDDASSEEKATVRDAVALSAVTACRPIDVARNRPVISVPRIPAAKRAPGKYPRSSEVRDLLLHAAPYRSHRNYSPCATRYERWRVWPRSAGTVARSRCLRESPPSQPRRPRDRQPGGTAPPLPRL